MSIVSSTSNRKDNTAKVHISSIEGSESPDSQAMILNVDIAFRLEVKQFPTADGRLGHQLMLSVADVSPVIHDSGLGVQHLVDLGVLGFSEDDPDFDEDVVCRDESGVDLWVQSENLRQVWKTLVAEVQSYEDIWLEPPYVTERRVIKIAVSGMDYFNHFISPDLRRQADIFVSNKSNAGLGEPRPVFTVPLFYK